MSVSSPDETLSFYELFSRSPSTRGTAQSAVQLREWQLLGVSGPTAPVRDRRAHAPARAAS